MILLDTQVLVWMQVDSGRLSRPARAAISAARREGGLAISAISLWELAMLISRHRIESYGTLEASVAFFTDGIILRAITREIAGVSTDFPAPFPKDPADRLIAATARVEGIPLVTHDQNMRRSKLLRTVW